MHMNTKYEVPVFKSVARRASTDYANDTNVVNATNNARWTKHDCTRPFG